MAEAISTTVAEGLSASSSATRAAMSSAGAAVVRCGLGEVALGLVVRCEGQLVPAISARALFITSRAVRGERLIASAT